MQHRLCKIGEQIIERLTYKPAEVRVIEEHYLKYTCRTCDRFVQAPVPKRAFDYTRFDDRMIAGLAVGKFADFLPNYRQEEIFKRAGVRFHRSTMGRLMTQAVNALTPLHEALDADLKSGSKLFMDETTMPQLLPGNVALRSEIARSSVSILACRQYRPWLLMQKAPRIGVRCNAYLKVRVRVCDTALTFERIVKAT
ncbi:IS66 family transposase [Roseobacter weihaiensis]|uniref:IS66 family transposase n=1 Tax=Roseobacter weihaiensis TaxID=2763262 RepID=UPI001D0A13C5|nr:transposase [Roseobacter sp. H9]